MELKQKYRRAPNAIPIYYVNYIRMSFMLLNVEFLKLFVVLLLFVTDERNHLQLLFQSSQNLFGSFFFHFSSSVTEVLSRVRCSLLEQMVAIKTLNGIGFRISEFIFSSLFPVIVLNTKFNPSNELRIKKNE